MFKIKNNHSPNYLADLVQKKTIVGLPSRKEPRFSIYSHFLGHFLIVLMLNQRFPTVGPFSETFSPQSHLYYLSTSIS